ncbi:MAG: hypothetical protein HKM06_00165, partial [Spirochaetales bacterium]|nr:hypothetical protein [Spirochaetales bacterium]
ALGNGENVAACGFRNGSPFLWKNGKRIPAPEGWRGLLTHLVWKGAEIVAVGRGAPGAQLPVQALLFEAGAWETLNLPSAGNFPSFVGVTPGNKIEVLGCEAILPEGRLQVWRWESGKLYKWQVKEKVLTLGPVDFSQGLVATGSFDGPEGSREVQIWDGKKTKKIENWPVDGTPSAITTVAQEKSLPEQSQKLTP